MILILRLLAMGVNIYLSLFVFRIGFAFFSGEIVSDVIKNKATHLTLLRASLLIVVAMVIVAIVIAAFF